MFTFDTKEFPLLEQTNDDNNTKPGKKQATQIHDTATVMTTNSTALNQVDLTALQHDIQKSIQDDLKILVQHEIQLLRQEFQASHHLMMQKQEQLSSTIELLQVCLTQIMKFLAKSSPSSMGGDNA